MSASNCVVIVTNRHDQACTCTCSVGEFGIVYKGHLLDSKTSRRKSFAVDLVAVKTLKGENRHIRTTYEYFVVHF